MMTRTRQVVLAGVVSLSLMVGATVPALAGRGGVPNENSCGGIGRLAQTYAANEGPMDPGALFDAVGEFTCDDVGEEHGQGF
jgi:hypothetical protein